MLTTDMLELHDRPAIVTGAREGIGHAVAEALEACGARVTAMEEAAVPEGMDPFELVVDTRAAAAAAAARAGDAGPWGFARACAEALAAAGRGGSILFVGSLADHDRGGVAGVVRELAGELGVHGIRVNALASGWIEEAPDAGGPPPAGAVPLGRPGAAEEVAGMALVLLSDALGGYVTGATVPVDGGLAALQAAGGRSAGVTNTPATDTGADPPVSDASLAALDVPKAVQLMAGLVETERTEGRMTNAGILVGDLLDRLAVESPAFDPLAAGFPTRLLFAAYALVATDYQVVGDDEATARIVTPRAGAPEAP